MKKMVSKEHKKIKPDSRVVKKLKKKTPTPNASPIITK